MKPVNIPFNIKLLNPDDERIKQIKPVTSLEDIQKDGVNFHPNGLFSTELFGESGSEERYTRFSYINLKAKIFQPVYYQALIKGNSLYEGILSGKLYAIWNEKEKDFERSDPMHGLTGFKFFLDHWKDIKIDTETDSVEKKERLQLLVNYKHLAIIDKLLVIPAGIRDVFINDDGRMEFDDINGLYKKLLIIANTIVSERIVNQNNISDVARYRLQVTVYEIYKYLKDMISGKGGLITGKWARRNIIDGTRNVISPMDEGITELGSKSNIGPNHTVYGLYQAMKSALPVTLFELRNNFFSKIDLQDNHKVKLVNRKTLKSEVVQLDTKDFDLFFTDEGINKIINSMKYESNFHTEVILGDHALSLIYVDDVENVVKLFSDIDELPEGYSRDKVRIATFSEIIYCSVGIRLNKLPVFITRYPVATIGSIYPSIGYIKTTVEGKPKYLLNDDWEKDGSLLNSFPVRGQKFISTINPNAIRLSNLGAD